MGEISRSTIRSRTEVGEQYDIYRSVSRSRQASATLDGRFGDQELAELGMFSSFSDTLIVTWSEPH